MSEKLGETFVEINAKLDKLNADFKKLERDSNKRADKIGRDMGNKITKGLKMGLGKVGGLLAGFFAIGKLTQVGKELVALQSKTIGLRNAYNDLTKAQGINADIMLREMRDAVRGTANDAELLQQANNAMLLGLPISTKEMGLLAKAGRQLGQAMGISAAKGLESLVVGIGRQSKLWLDNLGIIVDSDSAYKQMAKSLSKTTEELTDGEKKLAFYNATMDSVRQKMSILGKDQLTITDRYQKAKVAAQKLGVAIMDKLNPAVGAAADGFVELAGGITDTINEFDEFIERIKKVEETSADIASNFMQTTIAQEAGIQKYENMSLIIGKIIDELNKGASVEQLRNGNAKEFIKHLEEQYYLASNWAESTETALINMVKAQHLLNKSVQFLKDTKPEDVLPEITTRKAGTELQGSLRGMEDTREVTRMTREEIELAAAALEKVRVTAQEQIIPTFEEWQYVAADIRDSISSQLASAIGQAVGNANQLDDIFKSMLDTIKRMVIEILAMQALKAIFSAIGIPLPGAQTGGDFVGTRSGVIKAASGIDFTVPKGFEGDRFPLMVSSGENVSVRTPQQSMANERMLANINNSIQVMNANLIAGQSRGDSVFASVNIEDRDLELIVERSQRKSDRFR